MFSKGRAFGTVHIGLCSGFTEDIITTRGSSEVKEAGIPSESEVHEKKIACTRDQKTCLI